MVAELQILVDLQYLEQYVELRFQPSREEEFRPGTTVGELTAFCADTTVDGDARTISIRYDPTILDIKNAPKIADDVCLLTASSRDAGKTYTVVVASGIWDEYPSGGPVATSIRDELALPSGMIYAGLADVDRNLGFTIPEKPVLRILSIAFFWLGAACAGILLLSVLSLIAYSYAIDQGGLRQVLYDIHDVNRWIIYVAAGVVGLMILSMILSLATA